MREGMSARRDWWIVGAIWIALTVVAEWWAVTRDLHPFAASRESEIIDGAFNLLLYLGIPVFTFVLAVLGYSLVRFSGRRSGAGDGPPLRTNGRFVGAWMAVTSALAVFVIFNPGLKGLAELDEGYDRVDMTVDVVAEQWNWSFEYVDQGVAGREDELVLPVDTTVLFRVTSRDVIHSFWIPAFRAKIDAVPGKVTSIVATPTEYGCGFLTQRDVSCWEGSEDGAETTLFRVQCAELCGTGHPRMAASIRVVSESEFAAYIETLRQEQG